jgi:hypothetical protein
MVKLALSPDIGTVRNLLGLIQKALAEKPTDGSVVGNLLNMVNMWVDSVPAILENQEALDLVFQYRSAVIKNWVDVSTNRSLLDQSSSIIGFRALVKAIIDAQQTAKELKELREHTLREASKRVPVCLFRRFFELAVN